MFLNRNYFCSKRLLKMWGVINKIICFVKYQINCIKKYKTVFACQLKLIQRYWFFCLTVEVPNRCKSLHQILSVFHTAVRNLAFSTILDQHYQLWSPPLVLFFQKLTTFKNVMLKKTTWIIQNTFFSIFPTSISSSLKKKYNLIKLLHK